MTGEPREGDRELEQLRGALAAAEATVAAQSEHIIDLRNVVQEMSALLRNGVGATAGEGR